MSDPFSVIVQSLTALAIIFAALQLLFHSKQMHRDFEMMYVQRYWQVMDRRSDEFEFDGKPQASDREVIRGYLQLSEDEIDLRGLGRVSDNTWVFWSTAIVAQCHEEAYAKALADTPQDMFRSVRTLLSSDGREDPLKRRWLGRKLRGL